MLSEIVEEAATLQVALNQFDETGAVGSMQNLANLLKPIAGFSEFKQKQQTTRDRDEARILAEDRIQAKQNEFFVDGYLQEHLGDSTTQQLLRLRGQIQSAIKSNTIEDLQKANDETVVQQKNRILGRYEDRRYLFGFVNDHEFGMHRDPFAVNCGDMREVNKWKIGERFQSRWNAD